MEFTITSIVKLISLLLAAGFAILGTTTDYKKEGRVTKWGRVAIIGVVVSGLLSSVLLGVEETSKANERKKADADRITAEQKANNEKAELNGKFQDLVTKAEDNIGKTEESLDKTKEVAEDMQDSVELQKSLMTQTQNISGGVNKSVAQQGNILNQIQGQVALQQKTFDQTQELQKQQGTIFNQTQELQKQQGAVLQNTMRSLNSFKQFKVRYALMFPLETPELQHYLNDLKAFALSNRDNDDLYKNEKMKVSVVDDRVRAVEIFMDSPYFSHLESSEHYQISPFLTGSYLSLLFIKQDSEAFGADLAIETAAPGTRQKLEDDIAENLIDRPAAISQNFHSEVVFFNMPASRLIQKPNGIYLYAETNVVLSWKTDETRLIQSFADLPDSSMTIDKFPCGAKVLSFEFLTGDGYGTRYSFPKKSSDFTYIKFSDNNCSASYSFKKSDFGFF